MHAGIFSGQFEFGANIMPLWQAYTPAAGVQSFSYPLPGGGTGYSEGPFGGGTYSGAQPHAGDPSLELPFEVAALSAVVSGRRRVDLHHPQVSA